MRKGSAYKVVVKHLNESMN